MKTKEKGKVSKPDYEALYRRAVDHAVRLQTECDTKSKAAFEIARERDAWKANAAHYLAEVHQIGARLVKVLATMGMTAIRCKWPTLVDAVERGVQSQKDAIESERASADMARKLLGSECERSLRWIKAHAEECAEANKLTRELEETRAALAKKSDGRNLAWIVGWICLALGAAIGALAW